jgi:hypothetical protein
MPERFHKFKLAPVASGYQADFSRYRHRAPDVWTALAERSGDSAFERTEARLDSTTSRPCESGVALRLPPQSKIINALLLPHFNPSE